MQGVWGDLTPFFAVAHQVAAGMLYEEGAFPLWNRFVYAGDPLFAMPQTAVVGLTTVLSALFPVPLAIKLDIAFHVLMLGAGTFALARALGASSLMALGCGWVAVLNPYYAFHFHRGHINFINGAAYVPWLMVLLWQGLKGPRTAHAAWNGLLCGLLGALAVYEGGDVLLLFGALVMGLMWLCALVLEPSRPMTIRALVFGLTAAANAFLLSAFRLLPMQEYWSFSNRRQGVPWSAAAQPGEMLQGPAIHVVGLVACGFAVVAWRQHRSLLVALVLASVVGYAASHHEPTFRFLWENVPLVGSQRHPQRAEVMMVLSVPVLWAMASGVIRQCPGRVRWLEVPLIAMVLWSGWQHFRSTPRPIAPVDARVEPAANPVMKVARETLGDMRYHAAENTDRHWGFDHVLVPNNVEGLFGWQPTWLPEYMSPQFYIPSQVAFLDGAKANPTRIWGLLSAGLVSSTTPLNLQGLTALPSVPPCSVCQPRKSAGPYLYRNEEALPRMFTVDSSVLFAGRGRDADLMLNAILADVAWDPHRSVIIRAGMRGELPTAEQVQSASLVILHDSSSLPEQTSGAPVVRVHGNQPTEDARSALRDLTAAATQLKPVSQLRSGNTYQGCPAGGRFLVATSKFAEWPGWNARDDAAREWPIWIANGVTTAVPLQLGDQRAQGCMRLSYLPGSVVRGAAITLTSLPLMLALMVLARRRTAST